MFYGVQNSSAVVYLARMMTYDIRSIVRNCVTLDTKHPRTSITVLLSFRVYSAVAL